MFITRELEEKDKDAIARLLDGVELTSRESRQIDIFLDNHFNSVNFLSTRHLIEGYGTFDHNNELVAMVITASLLEIPAWILNVVVARQWTATAQLFDFVILNMEARGLYEYFVPVCVWSNSFYPINLRYLSFTDAVIPPNTQPAFSIHFRAVGNQLNPESYKIIHNVLKSEHRPGKY